MISSSPSRICVRLSLTVDQLEDVVENEERTTLGHQMEGLGVVHGALLLIDLGHVSISRVFCALAKPYQELAGHQNEDAAASTGLGIKGCDLVLHLLERETLQIKENVRMRY